MGPMGRGPMTGGGRGRCGGCARRMEQMQTQQTQQTEHMEMPQRGRGFGRGCGQGRGGGWRHRHWFHETGLPGWQRAQMGFPCMGASIPVELSKEQELALLTQQATNLEQTLGELKSRIHELDNPSPDSPEITDETDKEHE